MSRPHRGPCAVLAIGLTLAVPGQVGAAAKPVTLEQALDTRPENLLLDVGIHVLNPGIESDADPEQLEKQGVFPYLRRSEARCIPFELKNTLETSGYWGAVRVVPEDNAAVDLMLSGQIVKSTGLQMALIVEARDSTGRVWLKPKKYKAEADPRAYIDESDGIPRQQVVDVDEPYHSLFNRVANELVRRLKKLDAEEIATIRQVTELRFAEDLAPDAFDGYLGETRKGKSTVDRLPSHDDPMMSRVIRIRETDYEFIDTLNEYYAGFCSEMDDPYDQWRGYSYEEQLALRRVRRDARMNKIFGGLLIFAGAVAKAEGVGSVGEGVADVAQVAGGLMVLSGIAKGKDVKMHKETLRELAGSLDAEVEPMLYEVEGRTLRLSGSAEAQYAEFRRLLREIFAEELGLPLEPDTAAVTDSDD